MLNPSNSFESSKVDFFFVPSSSKILKFDSILSFKLLNLGYDSVSPLGDLTLNLLL